MINIAREAKWVRRYRRSFDFAGVWIGPVGSALRKATSLRVLRHRFYSGLV